MPAINFRKNSKVNNQILSALILSTIIIVGLAGNTIDRLQGIPDRINKSARVAYHEIDNISPDREACFIFSGLISPECIIGKNKKDISAIVIGDSHSASTVSAIADAIPSNKKGGVLFLGYSSCPTIPRVKIKGRDINFRCGEFVENVFNSLSNKYLDKPIIVVNRISYYIWGDNEDRTTKNDAPFIYFEDPTQSATPKYLAEFRQRYIESMCQLSKYHPVYITKPIPEIGQNVPKILARKLMYNNNVPDILLSIADYNQRNAFVIDVMEESRQKCGVNLLTPTLYLCPNGQCMGSLNGRPLYYDDNHLSEYGNRFLVPMFKQIFRTQIPLVERSEQ